MLKKMFLFFEVFLLLIFLRLSLSLNGISRLLILVKDPKITFVCNLSLPRNIRAIQLASQAVPKCTCLVQAAALKIIAPVNQEMTLVVGISNNQRFKSHAWVEIDNHIVFGEIAGQEQFKAILEVN
jgi:hypothetical protein